MSLIEDYGTLFEYAGITGTFQTVGQSLTDFETRIGQFIDKTVGNPTDWVSDYGQALQINTAHTGNYALNPQALLLPQLHGYGKLAPLFVGNAAGVIL